MVNTEPWDIKTEDSREVDGLVTFIIYCEDENSEPIYFRSLANERVKINAIPNQRAGKHNLVNTVRDCIREGRAFFSDNRYQITEGMKGLIWCVYDRDLASENPDEISEIDNYNFDLAIQDALGIGFNVAWSNDAFELWILLHFEDVSVDQILHRNYIYERLTEIFKTIQPRSAELDQLTGNPHFNYKHSFKKRDHFINLVLPFLTARRSDAIHRAKLLESHFVAKDVPFHQRNPCTLVHRLVETVLSSSAS